MDVELVIKYMYIIDPPREIKGIDFVAGSLNLFVTGNGKFFK